MFNRDDPRYIPQGSSRYVLWESSAVLVAPGILLLLVVPWYVFLGMHRVWWLFWPITIALLLGVLVGLAKMARRAVLLALDEGGVYLGKPPERISWDQVSAIVVYRTYQVTSPTGGGFDVDNIVVVPKGRNPNYADPASATTWGQHRRLATYAKLDREMVRAGLRREAPGVTLRVIERG